MSVTKRVVKWYGQMELSCVRPNQNETPTLGLKETLKCIPKDWLVVAANVGNHDPIRVL
jgi:hypothetical protein